MEIQYILSKVPRNSEVYVFGSILHSENPKDLDLLIIYDPDIYEPSTAYKAHQSLTDCLENLLTISVHATVLTHSEYSQSRFKEMITPIPLGTVILSLIEKFGK